MKNRAPSDKADKIIIRLPDGMRERLQLRAAAGGRSMTAEVVDMLERGLGEMPVSDLKSLYEDGMAIEAQIRAVEVDLEQKRARLEAIHEQIRQHIGRDMGDHDPLQYAWVYMQSEIESDDAAARQKRIFDAIGKVVDSDRAKGKLPE
jgi:plasmid stability protein